MQIASLTHRLVAAAMVLGVWFAAPRATAGEAAPTIEDGNAFFSRLAADGKLTGGWSRFGPVLKYDGSGCEAKLLVELNMAAGKKNVDGHIWWAHIRDLEIHENEFTIGYDKGIPLKLQTDPASAAKATEWAHFLLDTCKGK